MIVIFLQFLSSRVSVSMNNSEHFVQMTEHIRLSYARVLKAYLQIHNGYKHIKIGTMDEGLKKTFHWLDQYFYDGTRKLKWDNIRPLMPLNLENKVKAAYGTLCENEIRLCCLLLLDVDTRDISNILPYTKNSVYVVTNRIKKKTGMKNISRSLIPFLFTLE